MGLRREYIQHFRDLYDEVCSVIFSDGRLFQLHGLCHSDDTEGDQRRYGQVVVDFTGLLGLMGRQRVENDVSKLKVTWQQKSELAI